MRPSYAHYIELEAARLPVHEQMRTVCPDCQGGSKQERSLLITRETWGLRAHCFRATCPFHTQVTGSVPGEVTGQVHAPAQEPTHYLGTFESLDAADRTYFLARFYLELPEVQSWIGHNERNQYVMPIWDRFELRQGYVVRQKPWSQRSNEYDPPAPRQPINPYAGMARKTRAWPDTPETVMMSVYQAQDRYRYDSGTIVLVEDQISAMKVAQAGATGVALLGVGLNLDKVRELQKMHPRRVLVALDPDAGHLGFQMVGKWSNAFPKMRVLLPDADLKELPNDDVLDLLGRE